jgi:hypothetical protein
MYKGRKSSRSLSKLNYTNKKIDTVDDGDTLAVDDDIWTGLLKISKSSEDLWNAVYNVSFSLSLSVIIIIICWTKSDSLHFIYRIFLLLLFIIFCVFFILFLYY